MDRPMMEKVILEAIGKGASGNMLEEPKRRGSTISKIKKDLTYLNRIKGSKLAQIYERATAYLADTNSTPTERPITTNMTPNEGGNTPISTKLAPSVTPTSTNNTPTEAKSTPTQEGNIIERIAALENKNAALEQEIAELKRKIEGTEQTPKVHHKTPKQYTKSTQKVLGWGVRLQSKTSGGYRYEKWYATRTIAGKQKHIYLGDAPAKAEEKIRAYCDKAGIRI